MDNLQVILSNISTIHNRKHIIDDLLFSLNPPPEIPQIPWQHFMMGPMGPTGQRGDTGFPGRDGQPGNDGKQGPTGQRGEKGDPGNDGQDGLPGNDGRQGPTGQQGEKGGPGNDGQDGLPGRDGKDGEPGKITDDIIQEIFNKIKAELIQIIQNNKLTEDQIHKIINDDNFNNRVIQIIGSELSKIKKDPIELNDKNIRQLLSNNDFKNWVTDLKQGLIDVINKKNISDDDIEKVIQSSQFKKSIIGIKEEIKREPIELSPVDIQKIINAKEFTNAIPGEIEKALKNIPQKPVDIEELLQGKKTKQQITKLVGDTFGVDETTVKETIEMIKFKGFHKLEAKLKEFGFNQSADALSMKKVGMESWINKNQPGIQPLLTYKLDCTKIDDQDQRKQCEKLNEFADPNYDYGIYGDYLRCSSTINRIKNNFVSDLSEKYTIVSSPGGGKSGAYVFIVRDEKGRLLILKMYALKILDAIQDRDVREIFTTCAVSGYYGFPVVHDYGMTQYNSASPFWEKFKASYIDCVPDKDKMKDHKLYTRVYYIVSSLAGGKELNKRNLLKYTDQQLMSILFQLTIIFQHAQTNLPFFVHNDLHPGNIFIDDDYNGKLIKINDQISVYGPRVSIIDFDLTITDEFLDNLAKGRQYTGKYLIQEAMITLLNTYFGVNNTIKIIDYTAELWNPPHLSNNDDFRLWYVYMILFEIITIYKHNKPGNYLTIDDNPFALDLYLITKILNEGKYEYQGAYAFQKFGDFIMFIIKNKAVFSNNWLDNGGFLTIERPITKTEGKIPFSDKPDVKNIKLYKKIISGIGSIGELLQTEISFDNKINNFQDLMNAINEKTHRVLPIDVVTFIINSVNDLEKEVYTNSNPKTHFGLHNSRIGVKMNFGKDKLIKIPFYDKGNTINITLLESDRDRSVSIVLYGDIIEITLDNIIFNKNLIVDKAQGILVNIVTSLFNVNVGKIKLNKESGKIEIFETKDVNGKDGKENKDQQSRWLITWLLNWGIQSTLKEKINCPGIVFNKEDFVKNVLPNIEMILRYVYDIKAVESTHLIISDNDDNPKKRIEKTHPIHIIQIIDDIRSKIDQEIKQQIEKMPDMTDKVNEHEKKIEGLMDDNGFGLLKNHRMREKEREILRNMKILDANSLQQMINNVLISSKSINDSNEAAYKTYANELPEFLKMIQNITNLISENKTDDSFGTNLGIVKQKYDELMKAKVNIVKSALTEDYIKNYYHGLQTDNLSDKYDSTYDLIKQVKIEEKYELQLIKKLNELFNGDIADIVIDENNIQDQYKVLNKMLKKYKDNQITTSIRNKLIEIVNVMRKNLTLPEYQIDKPSVSFFNGVLNNRLKIKYQYLFDPNYVTDKYYDNIAKDIDDLINVTYLYDPITQFIKRAQLDEPTSDFLMIGEHATVINYLKQILSTIGGIFINKRESYAILNSKNDDKLYRDYTLNYILGPLKNYDINGDIKIEIYLNDNAWSQTEILSTHSIVNMF